MTTEPGSYNNAAWNEDGLPQELAKQKGPSGMWSLPPENLQRPKPGDKPSSVKDLADELGGLTSEDRKAWGGWVKEGVWVSTKSYAKTLAELAVDRGIGKVASGAGALLGAIKWGNKGKTVVKAGAAALTAGAKCGPEFKHYKDAILAQKLGIEVKQIHDIKRKLKTLANKNEEVRKALQKIDTDNSDILLTDKGDIGFRHPQDKLRSVYTGLNLSDEAVSSMINKLPKPKTMRWKK